MGFPCGSNSKESACNVGDPGSIPRLGRSPAGGHANPLHYSCLENPHGQRSLVGDSPWDCKESETTEQFSYLIAHNNYFFKSFQCIYYNRRLLDKILFSCNFDNIHIF